MTVGPGGEKPAAAPARGYVMACSADRERVIGALQAAFVQGMLDKDELDVRLGQALAARSYPDLAALTADLPAGLGRAQPAAGPGWARGRLLASTAVRLGACAIIMVVLVAGVAGVRASPAHDAQACRMFNTWDGPASSPASYRMWLLDAAVAMARQGSSRNLAADLQALQQAVRQYGSPGEHSGPASVPDQNQVQAASTQVAADCLAAGS